MSRKEFSQPIRKEALKRSRFKCEAEGPLYGLAAGQRCNAPLELGVEFDHRIADSAGGEPTLENCVACCPRCHLWKTRNVDTPRAAKIKRQARKGRGGEKRKSKMAGSRDSRWKKKIGGGAIPRWSAANDDEVQQEESESEADKSVRKIAGSV